MAVLKANQHASYPKDAIVLDLGDLGRQAARLRMAAEAKAAAIVTKAEEEAARLVASAESKGFEQGRQEGFAKGLAEGREQGAKQALAEQAQQLAQVQAAWRDVAQQLENQRKQMDVEARQTVLEFALKLTERIVHRAIEVDRDVIVDQVASALAYVLRPLDVVVRIHPEDRPLLETAMPQLMEQFTHLQHVRLQDDPEVTRGGCVVTYGQGEIDATIETQIRRVVDLVLPAGAGPVTGEAPAQPA